MNKVILFTEIKRKDEKMKWIILNEQYLDFLRAFEKRIPRTDYGTDKYKPFFGILFETDDFAYVTQVSSPDKPRLKNLPENIDFYKLYDPKKPTRLMSVVNLNYMFPVPKDEITYVTNYSIVDKLRTFKDENQRSKYIYLLKKELSEINKKQLSEPAKHIYANKVNAPNSKLANRCLNYKELESKAYEWMEFSKTKIRTATSNENVEKN